MMMTTKTFCFNTLFFAMLFTVTAMPARGAEVRFTLGWLADDPLLVRAALLAGAVLEDEDSGWCVSPALYAQTPEVAQMLLDAGAKMGEETLFWVRDARMAKFFVDAGAEVNVCWDRGFTPLVCSPSGDVTEVLLSAGAEVDAEKIAPAAPYRVTPLHFAPDAKAVRLLVAAGVKVDASTKYFPLTPLCCARNAELTRALLDAGANPCFKSPSGMTPLHFARDLESVRLLIAAGADVNARTRIGVTPLLLTVSEIHGDALRPYTCDYLPPMIKFCYRWEMMLREHEEYTRNRDEEGQTRKDLDRLAKARLLIAAGADVNAASEKGYVPLTAVFSQDMLRLLVEAGADVSAVDELKRTALFRANDPDLVRLMLAAGADPCHKDEEGLMPVHFTRDVRSVKLLLDHMHEAGMSTKAVMKASYCEGFGLLCHNFKDHTFEPVNPHAKPAWEMTDAELDADEQRWRARDLYELLRLLVPLGADVNARVYRGQTPLFFARKAETVAYLLAAGAQLDVRDNGDRTPLHGMAGNRPTPAVVQMLLDAGLDVNAEAADGATPLYLFSANCPRYWDEAPAVARVLLEAGADVNRVPWLPDEDVDSPLHRVENVEVAGMFIAAGANVNAVGKGCRTPLHVHRKSPEIVRLLIDAGADVNARDYSGCTPLFYAENERVVEMLLAAGADVNVRNKDGDTPLFCAESERVVGMLLAAGADADARDSVGRTPLFRLFYENSKHFRVMEAAGVDFHVRDEDGCTLLHKASCPKDVRYLVAKGLDVNARDKKGNTPLHEMDDLQSMKILLNAGADPNAENYQGYTPLFHYFNERAEMEEEVPLFLPYGLDVSKRDEMGYTLLHYCVWHHESTVMLLLAGADVNARNNDGSTPLFYAYENLESAMILIAAGADVNARDKNGFTPYYGADEDVRLLLRHAGAVVEDKENKEDEDSDDDILNEENHDDENAE